MSECLIQVAVFWIVPPCSVAVGYHRFGEPCCLHLRSRYCPRRYFRTRFAC